MLLENRIGIVSGIGPGMGREIALAFAREGAHLVLAARTAAALEEVAIDVRKLGRRALCVPTDIARVDDCQRLADAARKEFGRIDTLVNNAFATTFQTVETSTMDDWRHIFDVNLFGSLQLSQAVIPAMKEQHGGSIIMINSMSSRIVEPNMGAYAASKGALLTAAQTMARELGQYGIRVNTVVPGYIWSDKMKAYFEFLAGQQGTTPEAVKADICSRTALNHIPDSAEIADTVVFFASDLSRVVTGQSLDVNGGHYFH